MEENVVEVRNFRKTYKDLVAVEDISFRSAGERSSGLLGPNGAGKTSTLESLEGLRQPDGGTLAHPGNRSSPPGSRKLRDLIGVQLQASALPASMTPRRRWDSFALTTGGTADRFVGGIWSR